MDIYGSPISNVALDSQNQNNLNKTIRFDTENVNFQDSNVMLVNADNPQNCSSAINPSPFNTALNLLKNMPPDAIQWQEMLQLYHSKIPINSNNQITTPTTSILNAVTPSTINPTFNHLNNTLPSIANQDIINKCTENLFNYYTSLVNKNQHKYAQVKKYENYIINESRLPSFLKKYDFKDFNLPLLPKTITDQHKTTLLLNCQEILKKTKESLLMNVISTYHDDLTQSQELIKSFNNYETFIRTTIIMDMIDKFPILKDHLNNLFQLFLTKSQSLIQMGKDKYLARITKRNKEMNGGSSNNNSDEDVSLASTLSKKSGGSTKSTRSNNIINKRINNDIKNIQYQRPCRNGDNCRFRPNCLFFHHNDVTIMNPINNNGSIMDNNINLINNNNYPPPIPEYPNNNYHITDLNYLNNNQLQSYYYNNNNPLNHQNNNIQIHDYTSFNNSQLNPNLSSLSVGIIPVQPINNKRPHPTNGHPNNRNPYKNKRNSLNNWMPSPNLPSSAGHLFPGIPPK